jgi:hypothetical protein
MLFFIVLLIIVILFFAYEIWRAPLLDDDYKEIKPTKNFKDLFKFKKN